MNTVYLNNQWLAPHEATVSVFDRGFLFGDGIYEVIPVYNGHLFRFQQHLKRLKDNLAELRLNNPHSDEEWLSLCEELVQRNGGGSVSLYLQLSRGSTGNRAHAIPADIPPTVFATCNPLPTLPETVKADGVKVVLMDDVRWQWCHIKSTSLLGNVMLAQQAADQGASEALLHRNGSVYEGATSNVFAIKNGSVITPPKSNHLLPGITRDLVIELLESNGVKVDQRDLQVSELADMDELWISSSTREIYPVTSIGDQAVGNGKPGPLWTRTYQLYQNYKTSFKGE